MAYKDPNKKAEYDARYRVANKEKRAARKEQYRTNNKEKIRTSDAQYRAVNKDKIAVYKTHWKESNREKVREANTQHKAKYYTFISDLKLEAGCTICGYNADPKRLDFHHKDKTTKLFSISNGWSHTRVSVIKEVYKCDVYCKSCHSKAHSDFLKREQER